MWNRLGIALGICAFAAGCGGGSGPQPKPAPAVDTAPVTVRRVEVGLPFVGRAEAAKTVRLVALIDGRVSRVAVADGARMAAGATVFELGGPRVEAQRRSLGSAVEAARRRLAASRARAKQAQRRNAAHLAAPGEVSAARSEEAAAAGRLAEAQAALDRFSSALIVKAPAAGRFANRRVSPGQDVAPGDLLGEILEPASVRVTAEVLPRAGLEPRPGQPAGIQTGGGRVAGRLSAVQPEAGAAGTVRVWISGKELATLVPGTAVRGQIVVAVHPQAVTVPETAVVRDNQDRPLVFVGTKAPFERREVTTGETGPGWIEIASGLEPSDVVVTHGAYELYWARFGKEFKVVD